MLKLTPVGLQARHVPIPSLVFMIQPVKRSWYLQPPLFWNTQTMETVSATDLFQKLKVPRECFPEIVSNDLRLEWSKPRGINFFVYQRFQNATKMKLSCAELAFSFSTTPLQTKQNIDTLTLVQPWISGGGSFLDIEFPSRRPFVNAMSIL